MSHPEHATLGPLRHLVGIWEGSSGEDIAPSNARGTAVSPFRERTVFEFIGAVDNHEQHLFGLRYHTTAWRIGADAPFHEDTGYWLWEPSASRVMKAFVVPRGISCLLGGAATVDARTFTVAGEVGSAVFGIASNPFLDREFRTERIEITVSLPDEDTYGYTQDSVLRMKGRAELFHHTDKNVLRRVR